AGAALGGALGAVGLVPGAVLGFTLAFVTEQVLTLFPAGRSGATDVALTGPPALRSPALGLTWRLTPRTLVLVALVIVALVLFVLRRIDATPAGDELAMVRDDAMLAAALGVRVTARTSVTVAAACGVLAVAGAGTEVTSGVVGPGDVGVLVGLRLLAAGLLAFTFLGRSWCGPLAGVGAIWLATDLVPLRVAVGLALLAAATAPKRTATPADRSAAPRPVTRVRPATLTLDRVSVAYGDTLALEQLSLQVRGGEVHALVGANGSGKTTVLRAVCGEVVPRSGAVRLDDDVLHGGEPVRVRRGVVRTLQRHDDAAGLDAASQLRVAARTIDKPGTIARLVAGGADPMSVAGGSGPLALQRAVATGARVVLLDEPAAGTDATEQSELGYAITALARSGRAVLVIEHDLAFVRRVATTTTVLDRGRVIASGPTADVLADPRVLAAYAGVRP
ncbi:MAG TPA: ATP-binding cassette domain-containing protein, partial [Mycobacteriales bacterium]|nr:ATP-binding cassette domain-containing protein [Mycobacteriales bacterium]